MHPQPDHLCSTKNAFCTKQAHLTSRSLFRVHGYAVHSKIFKDLAFVWLEFLTLPGELCCFVPPVIEFKILYWVVS